MGCAAGSKPQQGSDGNYDEDQLLDSLESAAVRRTRQGFEGMASQGRAEEGIRLQLASWRRPRPDTAPTAAKCSGLYMIGTLARHAAAAAGCDDALLLDSEGRVAETTATNLLMVHDGVLVTSADAAVVANIEIGARLAAPTLSGLELA